MRGFHSVVLREKPPAKRPRIGSKPHPDDAFILCNSDNVEAIPSDTRNNASTHDEGITDVDAT